MADESLRALNGRFNQLKRWEESEANRASLLPKEHPRKVKFHDGCVFLAACSSGDREEVLQLLEKGVDINTSNIDDLTALHQVNIVQRESENTVICVCVFLKFVYFDTLHARQMDLTFPMNGSRQSVIFSSRLDKNIDIYCENAVVIRNKNILFYL